MGVWPFSSARATSPLGVMTLARLLTAIFVCGIALGGRASALTLGNAPWCAVAETSPGNMEWDCDFQTAAECAPHVIAGNRGFCNINPYWQPPPAPYHSAPRTRRGRHVHRH